MILRRTKLIRRHSHINSVNKRCQFELRTPLIGLKILRTGTHELPIDAIFNLKIQLVTSGTRSIKFPFVL